MKDVITVFILYRTFSNTEKKENNELLTSYENDGWDVLDISYVQDSDKKILKQIVILTKDKPKEFEAPRW